MKTIPAKASEGWKGVSWLTVRGDTVHPGRGHTEARAAGWLLTLHQHPGSRQRQEMVPGCRVSRPIFSDPLPPTKTSPPKGSTDSPEVSLTKDPVFRHVSLWETNSNHKKRCQVNDMGWMCVGGVDTCTCVLCV